MKLHSLIHHLHTWNTERKLKHTKKQSLFLWPTFFQAPENICIGKNIFINRYCRLDGRSGIVIGNNVLIGPNCHLNSTTHRFDNRNQLIREQGLEGAPIIIGNDVWLGANVVVLPGCVIGDGVVVGANSVVNQSLPPFCVAAGNPARVIKQRGTIKTKKRLTKKR